MPKVNDLCIVQATSLDQLGTGIGFCIESLDSQTVTTPRSEIHTSGLLPGEEAIVRIEHQSTHTGQLFGTIQKRLTTAPERVTPTCVAYGSCGSCTLQHIDYQEQLRLKKQWLAQIFSEANLPIKSILKNCIPAPMQGLYGRRQVKYVAHTVSNRVILGSYRPRSHEVIDMQGCRLIRPLLHEIAKTVALIATQAKVSTYSEVTKAGSLRYVLMRESALGEVQITFVFAEPYDENLWIQFSKKIRDQHPQLVSVVSYQNREIGNAIFSKDGPESLLFGSPYLWEPIGSLSVRLSARSFVQANHTVASQLYNTVAQELAPRPRERLLDLYCGVGGIAWTAWQKENGISFWGIEENPFAIQDAEATVAKNQISSEVAQFFCLDAEQLGAVFSSKTAKKQPVSLVSLNPPRKGASPQVLAQVIACQPRSIAYVSCNPHTLVRDLRSFANQGYQLGLVMPFDLHPHTPHIETVAILHRK